MTDASAFTDLYRRGQQAIAQEDGDAATAAFQALVKLAPASPLARLAAASCALLTGDLTTAEKHAGWLLGYVPGREVGAQALSLLGMVAFQRGDVELALRFHEAAAAAGADQATAQNAGNGLVTALLPVMLAGQLINVAMDIRFTQP